MHNSLPHEAEDPQENLAIISDTHLSVPNPQSLSLFPRVVARDGEQLYFRMANAAKTAFEACLRSLEQEKPDSIIHTGDVTGGWQEKGLINEEALTLARETAGSLKAIAPTHYALGNHDTGYSQIGSLKESGMTPESIDACREVYGPLYWNLKGGSDIHSLGIASPLADYEGNDPQITTLQRDQEAFVGDMLQTNRGEPWALYLHSIGSLGTLSKQIGDHAKHCRIVVGGDLHDPLKAGILKTYLRSPLSAIKPGFTKTARSLAGKFALCPSTAPLWWKGYERLHMTYKDAKADAQRIQIEYPPNADLDVPSSSMWWCLKGMFVGPKVD